MNTNLYRFTENDVANDAIKQLYELHLGSIIEMLADEPEQYNTFADVDLMLQSQKAQFVEMTLEPLLEDIKNALLQSLNNLSVQTVSITTDAEGLKDAAFKVSVTDFDDVPF